MKAMAEIWLRRLWRFWPAAAAAASALMLLSAHVFELLGYEPCALCLRQREVYWAALGIAVVSALIWARRPEARMSRAVDALLGAAFLTGAIVAVYHAGVEWKFWPGPATCTSSSVGSITGDDLAAALERGGHVVLCDEAAWRDPVLRLSMAGWNALISIGLGVASFFAAARTSSSMVSVDG